MEYEYWDIGEKLTSRHPNLGKTSTAKVLQALVKLNGRLHASIAWGDDNMPDHCRDVTYRISLPLDSKTHFEEMTGYILTPPPVISGN